MRHGLVFAVALLGACSDARHPTSGGDGFVTPTVDGSSFDLSNSFDPPTARVYAHSASALYSIDPDTLALTAIGPFKWPSGSDEMTDIALDKDGNMFGISADRVWSIDVTTAKCTFLSNFQGNQFNGLSFIAADQTAGGAEILVGAAQDGSVYRIDSTSGAQVLLGSYGSSYGSSGDLVSVQGSTYATTSRASDAYDSLVKVDAATGKATLIGSTGTNQIWGLGYWKQKLFGFTQLSGMVLIDINTGKATPIAGGGSISWYGAGVTTSAPITIN